MKLPIYEFWDEEYLTRTKATIEVPDAKARKLLIALADCMCDIGTGEAPDYEYVNKMMEKVGILKRCGYVEDDYD